MNFNHKNIIQVDQDVNSGRAPRIVPPVLEF